MKKVVIIALFIIASVFVSAESWNIDVKKSYSENKKSLENFAIKQIANLIDKNHNLDEYHKVSYRWNSENNNNKYTDILFTYIIPSEENKGSGYTYYTRDGYEFGSYYSFSVIFTLNTSDFKMIYDAFNEENFSISFMDLGQAYIFDKNGNFFNSCKASNINNFLDDVTLSKLKRIEK